jgi:hypothetical protein
MKHDFWLYPFIASINFAVRFIAVCVLYPPKMADLLGFEPGRGLNNNAHHPLYGFPETRTTALKSLGNFRLYWLRKCYLRKDCRGVERIKNFVGNSHKASSWPVCERTRN